MDATTRHVGGQTWRTLETGPADAAKTVLLLPGGLCTAEVFTDVMDALQGTSVRIVAATLPGFGRTPYPMDLSIENYAALASALAAEVGANAVAGHSMGANVALEMAAAGGCPGPALLLSPTFSKMDEAKELRIIDRVGRIPVINRVAWWAALKAIPGSVPKNIPAESRDRVMAILGNNDPILCRKLVRETFAYLDRRGDLVARLRDSGVWATVAFGDHDEVGLTEEERAGLEECERIELVTIDDASHLHIVERPDRTAELILGLVADRKSAT